MLKPEELLPTLPSKGPPLPRGIEQRWPMSVGVRVRPPIPWKLHWQREGIRRINEVIGIYEGHERELDQFMLTRLRDLRTLRDKMVRRAAQLTRLGR